MGRGVSGAGRARLIRSSTDVSCEELIIVVELHVLERWEVLEQRFKLGHVRKRLEIVHVGRDFVLESGEDFCCCFETVDE